MVLALARLLAFCWALPVVVGKAKEKPKKQTKSAGSSKCEKGVFESLSKDSVIPLCDAHYPDEKAKSGWAILFYNKDAEGLEDVMNRVALDLGNEPPEKSKNLKKAPKKQRTRIKDLAEKYEFEANIPKKGLEEKGKDALLKVGAVCCDCGSSKQELCETRENGLRIVIPGQDEKVMPDGEANIRNADDVMKFIMGELGFIKGQEPGSSSMSVEEITKKLDELKAKKAAAIEEEDFDLAGTLKDEIIKLEKKMPKDGAQLEAEKEAEKEALNKKIADLTEQKKKAAAEEEYIVAKKLKVEIEGLQAKLKKIEL